MTHDFQSVRVLLRNPDSHSREMVTSTLVNHGCRHMITADHPGEMDYYLRADMIDLLICDADLGLREACDTVHRMRNRAAGDNCFALSIILTRRPDPTEIAHLIDSGTDAVMVKPFQPAALAERIGALVQGHRLFVVTSAYVGPERRGDGMRPGTESAPRVQVPNPLRETSLARTSRDELRRKIRAAWTVVNEHRIERQTAHLVWLVRRIGAAFASRPPAVEAAILLSQLLGSASELRLRVAGTAFDHVAHLATTMMEICQGLGQNVDQPDPRWLAVLPKVAEAISTAFSRERDAVHASRQISDTVASRTRSEFPEVPQMHH